MDDELIKNWRITAVLQYCGVNVFSCILGKEAIKFQQQQYFINTLK